MVQLAKPNGTQLYYKRFSRGIPIQGLLGSTTYNPREEGKEICLFRDISSQHLEAAQRLSGNCLQIPP